MKTRQVKIMQLLYPKVKCAGRIVAVHLIGRFFTWVQWVLGGTFMGDVWKRSFFSKKEPFSQSSL